MCLGAPEVSARGMSTAGHPACQQPPCCRLPQPQQRLFGCREGHRHLSGEELQTWCMGRLSHQKIPRYWKVSGHSTASVLLGSQASTGMIK